MPRSGRINPLNALSTKVVETQRSINSNLGKKAPKIKPNIIMLHPLNLAQVKH
jgi:hypothetical protein